MDLSAEELQEAAADLQTMALQGRAFFDLQPTPTPDSHGAPRQGPETAIPYQSANPLAGLQDYGFRHLGDKNGAAPASACGRRERPRTVNLVVMFQGTAPPLTVVDLQARIGAEWHQLKAPNPRPSRSLSESRRTRPLSHRKK